MSFCAQDALLSDFKEKSRQKAASFKNPRTIPPNAGAQTQTHIDMHNSMVPLHIYINGMQIYHYVKYLQMLPSSRV